ncbi:Putative sensory transduction regulator [Ruminococcaceae bacterium YRB3002]|nr:Putative sensory transduction regulator [Ruminococcaceae bacterium YRB3002]
MIVCAKAFADKLTAEELNFDVVKDEDNKTVVVLPFDGRRTVFVFEDVGENRDSHYVQMRTYIEEGIAEDKYGQAVLMCNLLNAQYRWVKFYVSEENDFIVEADAILDPSSAGEEVFEMAIRNAHIIKDARPHIMKAIFG